MHQYNFYGKVLPERTNVSFPQIIIRLNHQDAGITGELTVEINLSQVSALFVSEIEILDILTLKNTIEDIIRFEVDILGFLYGCGYDIEITSLITSPIFSTVIFGVGIGTLENSKKERSEQFELIDILNLTSNTTGDYIRRCLSDLRESIKVAKDTGFFCYRAIESLKQYFINEYHLPEKEAWDKLREALNAEKEKIMFVKSFADSTRHGGNIYISGENRAKIFEITWDIVNKFIEFAINLNKNL